MSVQQIRSTAPPSGQLRQAFDQFVGETFFTQMLKSMRKSVGKPAYFHGGRAEEMFQSQLDQVLAEKMTAASAEQFTGPMFEQFTRQNAAHRPAVLHSGFRPLGDSRASRPLTIDNTPPALPLGQRPAAIALPPRQPGCDIRATVLPPRPGASFDVSG